MEIPSLTWTSLDAGLRPAEVERARVQWVDAENNVLRIPTEDSVKNFDYWRVSIRNDTAEALSKWIEEREVITNTITPTAFDWLGIIIRIRAQHSRMFCVDSVTMRTSSTKTGP